MEFPTLGKQCALEGCQQLDFLPFECDKCHKIHCLEHRSQAVHRCTFLGDDNVVIPQCPLCGQLVPVDKGDDVNAKMDSHINGGCQPTNVLTGQRSNPCSVKRCRGGELVPIVCPECRKNFCLSHRAPGDHNCQGVVKKESKKISKEKKEKQGRVLGYIEELLKTRKQTPTVAKVNLMRMKQRAQGNKNVPDEKRYYVEVVYPMDSKVQPKYMFFHEDWTIGKVLDTVADAGNIENLNNKMGEEKLYLFSVKTGEPIPYNVKLKDVDASLLHPGGCLLLEKMTNIAQQ